MKKIKKKSNFILLLFSIQFILFSHFYGFPQDEQATLKVVTELANIRAEPDIGSPIIHLASQGTLMEILGQEGPWFHVKILIDEQKKIEGYVHESLVEKILPEMPEEEREIRKEPEKETAETPKIEAQTTVRKKPYFLRDSQVYVSLSGGAHYALVGDLNKGTQGFADYYQSILKTEQTGNVEPLHLNSVLGGEVGIHLGQGFHLGIGADFCRGQKESSVEFTQPAFLNVQTQSEIKFIPIRLVLSYHITPEFFIKGGLEYTLAECRYFYKITESNAWTEWNGNADSSQLGGVMSLGYVHDLSRNLSMFIEASGRYAKVKNLKGEGTYKDSDDLEYTEKGYMYIYQGEASGQESFSLLFIRDKMPSGYGVSNPEKASLDLSGFSLKAGIKIRFDLF